MPECKDFTDVVRKSMERLRGEARNAGAEIPEGDRFEFVKTGVTLSVSYDEPSQTLTLCIVEKPEWIPNPMIWAIVQQTLLGR